MQHMRTEHNLPDPSAPKPPESSTPLHPTLEYAVCMKDFLTTSLE